MLEHRTGWRPFDVLRTAFGFPPNYRSQSITKATFILDETVRFSRTSRRRPMYTVTAIFDVTTINVAVRDIACRSGKHKRHVVKFQVTKTAQGVPIFVVGPFQGRSHDMKLFVPPLNDHTDADLILCDLGYIGLSSRHIIMP